MPFGQLLAGERRPEVVPIGLLQKLDGSFLRLRRDLAVGCRPRNPCTTTASPRFFIRFSRWRTHRSLTPILLAASRWVITLSLARFSHSNLSRSSWLILIRSILQP